MERRSPSRTGSGLVGLLAATLALAAAPAFAQSQYLICIDPGHGGSDPGAVDCNLNEEDINLDTSLRLRTLLQGAGFRVVMTRDADTTVELAQRSSYANAQGATRFVSVHTNAAGGTGIETYCHTSSTTESSGYKLANLIQEEMVAAWPLRNRGVKQADYHVLRETDMAATLTELAFIDSPSCGDAAYLGSPTHRQEAAVAHLRAIQRHFGFTPGGGTTPTQGTARGVVFQDQGVGSTDMSIKVDGATVTVLESGSSTTTDANGNWTFTLDPGSYTIKASKPGYQDAQRSCTVTSGGTAWCSLGIAPTSSNGFAKGVIFEEKGSGTGDMSTKLGGATVTVLETGASAVTPDTGSWSFELPAGNYTIKATKTGYQDNQRSCTVTVGGTAWCSIGLTPAAAATGTAAGIVFKDLGDGTKSPLPGSSVTVVESGASATADGSGYFTFGSLAAGTYTIKATMNGYQEKQVTCAVASGQTATCDIGLTPTTGTAYGVIYVDRGTGSNETRLSGATVTVVQTGASATAGLSGDWSFELAAGTYTLRVVTAGYQPAQRDCEVAAGRTVDCSIGMHAVAVETDAGTVEPQPDAGQTVDAGVEAGVDAGSATLEPVVPPDGGCGCASGGGEPAGLLLLGLAAAALLRRSRAGAGALALGLAVVVGNAGCTEAQTSPEVGRVQQAQQAAPFFEAGKPVTLAEGDWMAPVLAPQGDVVAFTRSGFEGLQLMSLETGKVRQLTGEAGAGYAPIWSRDGRRIAYRHAGQPFDEVPIFAADRQGATVRTFAMHAGTWALQRNDTIVLREGNTERIVAEGSDRYFAPFLSADGRHLVYNGLHSGLWIYRRHDGARIGFGPGSHPALSEDGRYLVFTRTKDDGEVLTAGELFVADLEDPGFRTAPVALEPGEIALHPSLSVGAGLIVYSTNDGRIRSVSVTLGR